MTVASAAADFIKRRGQTATTKRPTSSADSGGASKLTYATNLSGIKVWLTYLKADEVIRYGGVSGRKYAKVYTEPSKDILNKDRFVIGSSTLFVEGPLPKDNSFMCDHMCFLCYETEAVPT